MLRTTLALILFLAPMAQTQDVGRMRVKVIGGRLVVRCDLSTRFRRMPAHLFLDISKPCGLELHNQAANFLRVDQGGLPITIHLRGMEVKAARREHGDEDGLKDFTRLWSRELEETACVGTIGAEILRDYELMLDLSKDRAELRSPRDAGDAAAMPTDNAFVTSLTLRNDMIWLPVRLGDGGGRAVVLDTSRHDSLVDSEFSDERDAPSGEIGSVQLGDVQLDEYLAFRPEELVLTHPDGVLGTLGLGFLNHFKVEIDRVHRQALFTPRVEPDYPEDDRDFFRARAEEEIAPMRKFLETYPGARLAREAAALLLDLQIDEGGESESFDLALDWMDRTRIEDLRATEAIDTMRTLVQARRPDVAIMAGRIGLKSGRDDRYPESVHRLHSQVGKLILDAGGRDEEAWEHLLSSAFGLPNDGFINLDLGRYYERVGRYRRAMSRYIQAVIVPESGPQAVEALTRLQKLEDGGRLSVDRVDRLVAGKVYNLSAPTLYEPDPESATNRCVLVELFTNAHFGVPMGETWRSFAIGGSMGVEGLLSHFAPEQLAVLSYHIPAPEPTALQSALTKEVAENRYQIASPEVTVIDGRARGPGAGRWIHGEAIYEANRELVTRALKRGSEFDVDMECKVVDGRLQGSLRVDGPERSGVRVELILAERGVLYPGKAQIVVHRMVARAALLNLRGERWKPENGSMEFKFDKGFKELEAEQVAWLESFEKGGGGICGRLSTSIDPRQVTLVAIIRDDFSNEVLQAHRLDYRPEEKR